MVASAPEDKRRARTLELVNHQAGKRFRVSLSDAAGHRHRRRRPHHRATDVDHRDAVLRGEQQLGQAVGRVMQRADRLVIQDIARPPGQLVGAPIHHRRGQREDVVHIRPAMRGKDERLAGVAHHGVELVYVTGQPVGVGGDAHRHAEVDVLQPVAQAGDARDIRLAALAVPPGVRIDHAGAIRPGAEIALADLQRHRIPPVPVVNRNALRRRGERLINQALRYPHARAVDLRAPRRPAAPAASASCTSTPVRASIASDAP